MSSMLSVILGFFEVTELTGGKRKYGEVWGFFEVGEESMEYFLLIFLVSTTDSGDKVDYSALGK